MSDETEDLCPNCVTPWKCNGPHIEMGWATVLRRALDDNESRSLDSQDDREHLVRVLDQLMRSAERHGYVNGAMDVSDAAEAMAYANGFSDALEGST